ncbi:MAG: AraC family transcriptional regulator [Alteromonadaceae bacterium]|jgi:AraC family transcriptional regulator
MQNTIQTLEPKTLIGLSQNMSLANNLTGPLWQGFMPRRNDITNRLTSGHISMQVYDKGETNRFSPATRFDQWAAVEVADDLTIPKGMAAYSLAGGLYAVFVHRGPASAFGKTMAFIFGCWLPGSDYELDNREHFEVLLEGYNPMNPQAQEEVWIPIKAK